MPEIEALIADARRAAISGAIGSAPDRPGALVGAELPGGAALRTAPRASALEVAIDGPGLFVLARNGERRFARLGDFAVDEMGFLANAAGARALGFGVDERGEPVTGLSELRVLPADLASHRFASFTLDERGVFAGVTQRIDARTGRRRTQTVSLGRLALAILPAPERLTRDGDSMLALTAAAGRPTIGAPGDDGMSGLRPHALETGMVDIEGDLARLWSARRRAEFEQAVAASSDQNARTALGLVK
jgi:flagellar hook protein FlgE